LRTGLRRIIRNLYLAGIDPQLVHLVQQQRERRFVERYGEFFSRVGLLYHGGGNRQGFWCELLNSGQHAVPTSPVNLQGEYQRHRALSGSKQCPETASIVFGALSIFDGGSRLDEN
jgi:hypothetical protein